MIKRLDDIAVDKTLETLPGWRRHETRSAIVKSFKFRNFDSAWTFMSRVAQVATEMDHHPEWSNVYNRVEILLTTHDAGGVSERDTVMARRIEALTAESQ